MTGLKKHSRPVGEIDIAVFRDTAADAARTTPISLKDDFDVHVNGLKKFERAQQMEVLDQHPMQVAGAPGLFTKDRYYDPQDRSAWLEEVLFVQRKTDVYRVELECPADQVNRFEPVFLHLISTLQFDCRSGR